MALAFQLSENGIGFGAIFIEGGGQMYLPPPFCFVTTKSLLLAAEHAYPSGLFLLELSAQTKRNVDLKFYLTSSLVFIKVS